MSRYELPDSKGEAITDAFFEDERRKFNPGGDFEIKKSLSTKKGRTTLHLVPYIGYIGYPSSMDEWVTSEQLTNL